ncbi:MAG TPA: PAS domain S-box protein, partial [Candidatus Methylomirabilis sp.]|nr:PAS domain S-box protein [Candidatus Methylomirabilis sp.]
MIGPLLSSRLDVGLGPGLGVQSVLAALSLLLFVAVIALAARARAVQSRARAALQAERAELAATVQERAAQLVATRDVLQTHMAEHEHTLSLLASIVASSHDAIIGQDLDGRILSWNAGAQRIYGFTEAEIRGRTIDVLLPPGRTSVIPDLVDRVQAGQTIEHIETEHLTKDGRRLWVFLTVSPIRDDLGNVVGISRVIRDVTAQKEAQQAVNRSEATARALLESAAEAIIVTDEAGRIGLVNAKTEAIFGYAREELIGQALELLLPARFRESHAGHRAGYMADPRVRSMGVGLDLAGRRKDGAEFPVEVSLSFVKTDKGTRAMAFITDISERVALQRAARQADKLAALGTLSAGIAHEINNPIGIISSRVELMMLEGNSSLSASLREDLDVILRHARRVSNITRGLLSFARQSSGAQVPVSLNKVVEDILELVQKEMSRGQIRLNTSLSADLPPIRADANAIGQVVLNLLNNARSAMVDGG